MDRFAALADPTRRHIVEMLGASERTAGEIARHFPISAPAVSQHLKALRESGLVRVQVDGQRRIYSLDPNGFHEMDAWFERMRTVWSRGLGRLEQEIKKEQKT